MNSTISFIRLFALLAASLVFSAAASAVPPASTIASRTADVDGVKIHYLVVGAGSGKIGSQPVVILLHGYAETSRMWRPIFPRLEGKFTVIAPDLPGIGASSIPTDGLDMESAAVRIHDLAKSLGVAKARVVGHDIGLMVAYAYAAQFPAEVEKLVVMDAFLPGVPGWASIYDDPNIWHFRFHGKYPELLVQGRERTYFEYFWNELAADQHRSLPEADRAAYTHDYAQPGRMRAAWAYFGSWPQTAKDFATLAQTKLTMPVLSIGGDKSLGGPLADQMKLVATDVTVVVLTNSGHWIMEEHPKETMDALVSFL